MGWDNITGDSKILPSTGGSIDEIKLESNQAKRIRLVLRENEQPYSYLEHTIEAESIENGATVRSFRTIRCPKTAKNPNAHCPICDGQQFKRRVRNAANVWDYELGKIQKLNQGDGIWKPIATTRKLGIDVLSVDWGLMKTGQTRNDIEYTATNLGPSNFVLPADAVLFDIESEYQPHSIEDMKAIIDSLGLDWNKVITPPALNFPSLEDALKHVMPNGKYKDQTFKQIWEADMSNKGMINFLATKSDRVTPEKAAAQVILVNLGGANIDGVPKGGQASQVTPTQTTAPTQTTQTTAPTQTTTAIDPGRNGKIEEINKILSSSEKFVKGGFALIMDTMKEASNGKTNISDFSDAELDKMLEICNK